MSLGAHQPGGCVARSGASKLRYAILCIEMPEVAYSYGYLLVSAQVYTSDCTPTSCRSDARGRLISILGRGRDAFVGIRRLG